MFIKLFDFIIINHDFSFNEHKKFQYRKVTDESRNFGDISKQKQLRADLKCKPFKCFIDNVYSDIKIPDELKDPPTPAIEVVSVGQIKWI